MKRFLLSILAGIGNITPGLSGSAMMIIFNLYEPSINAISNILKDFKNSLKYLIPIALGIAIGTFLTSGIIEYTINNYQTITYIIFTFFIFGTIPTLIKQATKKGVKESYIIPFLLTLSIGILLLFIKREQPPTTPNLNFLGYVQMGLILAFSTIIPGISGTVIFTMMGTYELYLNAINTLNISKIFPIALGLIIGGFILSKIITYLLNKYYGLTYFAIMGFTISTIPALFLKIQFKTSDIIIGIILGIIAFLTTIYTFNKSEKLNKN